MGNFRGNSGLTLVASNLTLKLADAQAILETEDPVARLTKVNQSLENEIGILEMQVFNGDPRGNVAEGCSILARDYNDAECFENRAAPWNVGVGDGV